MARAEAAGKKSAEAAETAKANLHADVGDQVVTDRQQVFCSLKARANAELVRRFSEDRREVTDEVKGRHGGFTSDAVN